jgi:AraC-like DNA-binding protein
MDSKKEGMGYWLFRLDDPALYRFYEENAANQSLYYAIVIQGISRKFSDEAIQVLHLYPNTMLLVKSYLIPVYYNCNLQGLCFILSENFANTKRNIAYMKLCYVCNQAEGVIDFKTLNAVQKDCLRLIEMEYAHPYDSGHPMILHNLMVNLLLLSSSFEFDGQLKTGHLLSYAVQFIDLLTIYAGKEKSMTFYADKLNITSRTLTRAIRFIYKKTFREILWNYLVIEAMYLLIFTSKNITQIAHELNFDVSHFIRFFSEKKGMHPKELRERYCKIIEEINYWSV